MLGDDGVLALEHRGPVERGRADAPNAEFGGVLQVVPDFGVEEQGLGGDATHQQASTPKPVELLDQCDLQPIFRATNRRRVAGVRRQ